MKSVELRLHNVRLLCLACRTRLEIPGPWDGLVMAGFRAQHRWVMLAGWTLSRTGDHVSDIDLPEPPAVHLLQ